MPATPPDDCSPIQHLDYIFIGDPEVFLTHRNCKLNILWFDVTNFWGHLSCSNRSLTTHLEPDCVIINAVNLEQIIPNIRRQCMPSYGGLMDLTAADLVSIRPIRSHELPLSLDTFLISSATFINVSNMSVGTYTT